MEERLTTLVKSVYHTNFEQDTSKGNMEGDTVEGRYLVKPTTTDIETYLNDPTQKLHFTIRTNVKLAGG